MASIQGDTITNGAGTGAPSFTQGIIATLAQFTTGAAAGYVHTSDASGNATWQPPGVGNVTANDSNVVFTSSSSRLQICNPTATRTYTLPTTGILAGDKWTFYNQATSSANYITIQSSGANTIAILPPLGVVTFYSAVATPTSAANWILADRVSQLVAYTPTFSAGFGTVTSISCFYKLISDVLYINGSCTVGTVAASIGTITLPSGLALNSSKITIANTSANPGPVYGVLAANATSNTGNIVTATSTSTSLLYTAGPASNIAQTTPTNVNNYLATGVVLTFSCAIPIAF